ncbi:MAG: Trp biosynthesis-associated membrane protein, partial [Actinomycetales bacterium]|nr:Trp biosynthesis-associated membrane protein [Actinomycetales bacterium]
GAGSGLSALDALRAPEEASRSAVASATGVLGSTVQAETTTWPLVALLPALAVAAIGVLVLVIGRNWPVGTRYRSAAVIATADPGQDPAAAWDALTRGEDPSLDGTGEDAAADGVEQSAEEDPRTSR